MTTTEPPGARVAARLGELGNEFVALFSSPDQRTYWLWLLSALVLWLCVAAARRQLGRSQLRQAWGRWLSASSRLDLWLAIARPIAFGVFALPWALSAYGVSIGVVRMLDAQLGVPASSGWSDTSIVALYTVVLFVAWDASRFAMHWAMHRFDVLWQFHQVHHSAEVLTAMTLHRVHPVESALYRLRAVLVTGLVTGVFFHLFRARAIEWQLLGVNAIGLAFNAVGGNLRHSHLRWGWGRLERWLLSPAQHQDHHAVRQGAMRTNYGTWLSIWDRLLGSWVPSRDDATPEFGLDVAERNHAPDGLVSALFDPVWSAGSLVAQRVRRAPAWSLALMGLVVGGTAASFAHARGPAPQGDAPPSDGPDADGPPRARHDFAPVDLQPTDAPVDEAPSSEPPAQGPADDADDTGDTDDGPDLDLSELEEEEGADLDLSELEDEELDAGDTADAADTIDSPDRDGAAEATGTPKGKGTSPDTEVPAAPVAGSPAKAEALTDAAFEDVDMETETVSIIGDAEAVPRVVGSAHRLGKKALDRLEQDDVHALLQLVPGVYVRGEDGFGLRPNIGLRGVDSNRSSKITLMEDGILLGPAPYAAPAAYYFPLTTRMVGLEVFKGPASIRHGPNTIGGAINMQTRTVPRAPAGGLDLGLGLRGYGKAHGHWGRSWRYGGLLIEGVRLQSNGFKELDGGGETGFGKNEAMIKGRVHTNPANAVYHQWDAKLGLSTERSYETYLGLTPADFEANPYRRYVASQKGLMQWWRSQAELSYLLAKDELIEFRATAYRHDFDRSWRKFNAFAGGPDIRDILSGQGGGQADVFLAILRGDEDSADPDQTLRIGTNARRYVSQGLQTQLHIRPQTKYVDQDIEFGARVHHDQIRRDHTESGFLMVSRTLVPDGGDTDQTALNRGRAIAGAFHLVDEIRIVDAVTVTPGARVELIQTRFEDELADTRSRAFNPVFLPGIGAYAQIIDQLGVFAGVHSGFSPVAPGQPDEVKPERSINYELGLRARHRGFSAEATGFYNDYSNLTGECTFAQGCDDTNIGAQFNAGEVQVAGTELSGQYTRRIGAGSRRPAGWIQGGANYTFTWSRFESSFTSSSPQFGVVEAGDALPYVPVHTASATLAGGTRRFSLHSSLRFNGAMRDVPGQGEIPSEEEIPAFVTLDAGARVWITARASVYSNFSNLTNARYAVSARPFGLRPGRPLFGMVGFKYEFG